MGGSRSSGFPTNKTVTITQLILRSTLFEVWQPMELATDILIQAVQTFIFGQLPRTRTACLRLLDTQHLHLLPAAARLGAGDILCSKPACTSICSQSMVGCCSSRPVDAFQLLRNHCSSCFENMQSGVRGLEFCGLW